MKPVPPVMNTTYKKNQRQVLFQMYSTLEDLLCPCRTPLRDCHPPSWWWTKNLPESPQFFCRSWATSRDGQFCYVVSWPVRSQLSTSEDQGCGIPSWCSWYPPPLPHSLAGSQLYARYMRAPQKVMTGLSTRWQGFTALTPNWGPTAQNLSTKTGLGTSSNYWPAGPL